MVRLGELMMILDLHRRGSAPPPSPASSASTARQCANTSLAAWIRPITTRSRGDRGAPTTSCVLRERLAAYPGLSAVRLLRELRERGFGGGYTAVKRAVQDIRPDRERRFEVRFETPPGEQAQVDFARFEVVFADEPGVTRIVWLFSMVLGFSRLIWARFVVHQDLQSVLRCHVAAFTAIGGAPREILYDRMKTAVIGEDADGLIIYNRSLIDLARHGGEGERVMTVHALSAPSLVDRIKTTLVGLRMPRALEIVDVIVRQLERGETTALEAIDSLLMEDGQRGTTSCRGAIAPRGRPGIVLISDLNGVPGAIQRTAPRLEILCSILLSYGDTPRSYTG